MGLELVPKKICSMDCLYCEVGPTTLHTLQRAEYVKWSLIEKAIYEAREREERYDVLTFTGSGEPTLNINFEEAVNLAKRIVKKPLAVLTNSTLLEQESIREALSKVDLVLASLDSVREQSFKLVNRPVASLVLEKVIEGLKDLRREMRGELWLEVLLVEGFNDKEEDLKALKETIEKIKPHRVQLNTVVRPPAYAVAKPLSWEALCKVREFLGDGAEIITPKEQLAVVAEKKIQNIEESILDYLARRPAPVEELKTVFNKESNLEELLEKLVLQGRIKKHLYQGEIFYIS
ncbi:MAG: radical SAM protein [Caldimicrobium sp.]|nr:radical SAM protein [Caldimicrobium sp.]MCX7874347.1 radical SAM protein [Caldimicrobium sp.]MDW8094704.1 radical SAM protein [Caldimicrobium sp.]